MRQQIFLAVPFTIVALLLAVATSARGAITLTSASRTVSIDPATSIGLPSPQHLDGAGVFGAMVNTAGPFAPGAPGMEAIAEQQSFITSSSTALNVSVQTLRATSRANGGSSATPADATAFSNLTVAFTLSASAPISIFTASNGGGVAGAASDRIVDYTTLIRLYSVTGAVDLLSVESSPSTFSSLPVNYASILAPGSYTFEVSSTAHVRTTALAASVRPGASALIGSLNFVVSPEPAAMSLIGLAWPLLRRTR